MEKRKVCSTCKKSLPLSKYAMREVKGRQYPQPSCRKCTNAKRRKCNKKISQKEIDRVKNKLKEVSTKDHKQFEKTYYMRRVKSGDNSYTLRKVLVLY